MKWLTRLYGKIQNIFSISYTYNRTLQKRVYNYKKRQQEEGYVYQSNPKISFILQFFNKRENIKPIMKALRAVDAEEIIVIDDGSIDNSYKEWLKHLNRPNDFLLRSNDLHEVRTYDRAIRMAKGEFVCLLQDDDIPPKNKDWLDQAATLFAAFPLLLMLSGRQGCEINPVNPNVPFGAGFAGGGQICTNPVYTEPKSGIAFMFFMAVNRSPVFLRRKEFQKIGGINQEYAPLLADDIEASIRTWLSGCQVGFYSAHFKRRGMSGQSLFNEKKSLEQDSINMNKIYNTYTKELASGYIKKLVDKANSCLREI